MTETILFIIISIYMVVQLGMTIWAMKKMKDITDKLDGGVND